MVDIRKEFDTKHIYSIPHMCFGCLLHPPLLAYNRSLILRQNFLCFHEVFNCDHKVGIMRFWFVTNEDLTSISILLSLKCVQRINCFNEGRATATDSLSQDRFKTTKSELVCLACANLHN